MIRTTTREAAEAFTYLCEHSLRVSRLNAEAERHGYTMGLDLESVLYVRNESGDTWRVTTCCGASAKGSFVGDEPATVCRGCYERVGDNLGLPPILAPAGR